MSLPIGAQKRTTDGVIGVSGAKIRLYELIVVSTGGGGAVVNIYDGTSTAGVLMDTINGTTSLTVRAGYVGGLFLGSGCYIDLDANTSFVTAIYEQENSIF